MLHLDDIRTGYGKMQILHGVSLSVQPGQIVCIIGANGSGKSTIFKTIFGLLPITIGGTVSFNGKDLTNKTPQEVVRRGISYVPQSKSIFRNLTVIENLRMGAYIRTDKNIDADIEKLYGMFPILHERRDALASSLSGGEQQMLVIGRALLLNPDLIMLDEPSLGLAPRYMDMVFAKIAEINKKEGKAVLVIEQNARRALEIADYTYVFDLGRVRFEGPPAEILRNNEVQKLYLGG